MEQIIVQVRDKEKAKVLLELLAALDFVDSVKTTETAEVDIESLPMEEEVGFFSLAGLWQERDITLEAIRQKAWPRQSQ
ncbi:MAG: hypothetical protein KDJ52_23520 [Anaerolineae bacterium]|nr:hypothetical protein [Anaerolineae bacterium]